MDKPPVLLIVFNRPETTRKVFEAIRAYQPQKLLVAADGPRPQFASDASGCAQVRDIVRNIDWPCETEYLFHENNLGCREAPAQAISWFFDHVEEGIILEDDCLPSPDFFRFCSEMLERYRNESRIMHVGGTCFQFGYKRGEADYFFSRLPLIWGWASWRRAWQFYDVDMGTFPEFRKKRLIRSFLPGHSFAQWRFLRQFLKTWEKSQWFNTWDVQWVYTLFRLNALAVNPNYNLVSNIGGTSTHEVNSEFCNLPHDRLPEKLIHPLCIREDEAADSYAFDKCFRGDWKDRVRYILSRITFLDWM